MGVKNSTVDYIEKGKRSGSFANSDKKIMHLPTGQVETSHFRKSSFDVPEEKVLYCF